MKSFKKILSAGLAALMCAGTMGTAVMAEPSGETWNGDKIHYNVQPGTNGYNYVSAMGTDNWYYETSNHVLEITGGGAVSLYALTDASVAVPDWTPNAPYVYGSGNNYEVLYCCDQETGIDVGFYYKRMNLEDSNYYSTENAKKIRAILTNSYPYVSIDDMQNFLDVNGFKGGEIDHSDAIAAVQAAVWACSNGQKFGYRQTVNNDKKYGWGHYWYDYSTREYTTGVNEAHKARVEALIDFLLALPPVEAQENQIVITDLKLKVGSALPDMEDEYKNELTIKLNHGSSNKDDNISIAVYADGVKIGEVSVVDSETTYTFEVDNEYKNADIKAVLSGTQVLEKGVYFYEPEGGRGASQCLVGVAEGATSVYDEEALDQDAQFTKTYTAVNGGTNPAETFTFIYEADEVKENSSITKEMMPVIPSSAVTFTKGSATSTQTVNVDLSDIDWPGVGIYYYKVTELEGNTLGVEYDDDVPTLKITVAYDEGSDTYYTAFVSLNANRNGVTTGDKTHGFENKYKAGDLTITKNVTGNLGDLSKDFEVTVTFTNPTNQDFRSVITYASNAEAEADRESGEITTLDKPISLNLKNGETVTFSNIPYGITYTVVEEDYTDAGYEEAKYKLNGGEDTTTSVADKIDSSVDEVVITNTKDTTVDTGISVDSIPYIVMLGAAMFGGTGFMISKKRRSED